MLPALVKINNLLEKEIFLRTIIGTHVGFYQGRIPCSYYIREGLFDKVIYFETVYNSSIAPEISLKDLDHELHNQDK
jgi:hypothetical protein